MQNDENRMPDTAKPAPGDDPKRWAARELGQTAWEARQQAPDYVIEALQEWLASYEGQWTHSKHEKVRYWVHGDEADEVLRYEAVMDAPPEGGYAHEPYKIGTAIHQVTETLSAVNTPASVRIRTWLLDYAWLGTGEEQAREVECIMHHEAPNLPHLEARVEQLLAQRSGERSIQEDVDEAVGIALSTLYECHDAPHLKTCPRATPFTVKE